MRKAAIWMLMYEKLWYRELRHWKLRCGEATTLGAAICK